jgi:hypothetical protein
MHQKPKSQAVNNWRLLEDDIVTALQAEGLSISKNAAGDSLRRRCQYRSSCPGVERTSVTGDHAAFGEDRLRALVEEPT